MNELVGLKEPDWLIPNGWQILPDINFTREWGVRKCWHAYISWQCTLMGMFISAEITSYPGLVSYFSTLDLNYCLSLIESIMIFHDFPWPPPKFYEFPGFPWPVRILWNKEIMDTQQKFQFLTLCYSCCYLPEYIFSLQGPWKREKAALRGGMYVELSCA